MMKPIEPNPDAWARSTMPVSLPSPQLGGVMPDDAALLEPGSFIGHYEIIRELGHGGMGRVFLARDTRLARLCAIKVLLAHTGEHAERFLAEARATARCKHESIVVVYEVDELHGYPYMVLEYLEGRTLRAWMLEQRANVPARLAAEIMIPVVRALVCAHEMGIVHRDLKPENIVLTELGQVKVLDFGIAKWFSPGEPSAPPTEDPRGSQAEASSQTRDGAFVGTPQYMSPEQWSGLDIDPQSDVWAAGIILHELVTGSHPLASASLSELCEIQNLDIPMPRAREKYPDAGALGDIVDRCLTKRKSERMGSATELLGALESLVASSASLTRPADDNPFAGLSAFQESDAARFFGRDHDIASVLGRLRSQALVVVAGPSGAGKSSFVRAGIVPALKRAGGHWEAFILRPGRRPLSALADVLGQVSQSDDGDARATLRSRPGSLGTSLRARCRRAGNDHHILLFVDQFEELYTLGAAPDERAAFLSCLEGVADDPSSPLRVALAVRSDFLDRMAENRHFTAEVTRGLVLLPPVGREGLREALTRPVEAAGHRFEGDALVDSILDTLTKTHSPLPLLQFTASKLWEARDRERKLLSMESHRALGGVEGALSSHADAVLATLSRKEQKLARAILQRLVTPERTRAIVNLSDLRELAENGNAAEEVAHRLAEARLLVIETGGEQAGGAVEIVHESLIEGWAKLRQWLDESEQDASFLSRLRTAAQQWEESGRPEGLLWRDRAAKDARDWFEQRRAEGEANSRAGLGKREASYLSAVVTHFESARLRRRRNVIGLIATLAVIAFVVSYLAIRAEREAGRAQAEARQARNATRMATARELSADPTMMLALLREVEPPEVPRGFSELSRWALSEGPAREVLAHADELHSAAFSPDGERIVIASGAKVAIVQNADGTGIPVILRGHENRVMTAFFSPDGKRVVTGSWDKTARVWNADGSGEPLVLRGHENGVYAAGWSPDGKCIVTASTDKSARIWNADGSGEPLILRGHDANVVWAAFSPDGTRVVTASWDKTARVWNADGRGEPLVLRHEEGVNSASWSPDGKRIVTALQRTTARVWNADGSGEPIVLRGHQGEIDMAAFSPDGHFVITASGDGTARVWFADGAGEPRVLRGHQGDVTSAFFSPDGKRIVTASFDKTVRIWNADVAGRPQRLREHSDHVVALAFSPDGKRVLSASLDKTARLWNADGAGEPLVFRHSERVFGAAYSLDGKRIVTATPDGAARVWNADGSGAPRIFRHEPGGILSAAFDPSGERIVTTGVDRTARVWNVDGAGEPIFLRGHRDAVNGAAFSPDGKRIVTTSLDETVRIWFADGTGEPFVLRGHEGNVYMAAWGPDGKRIVTTSWDKTMRVWFADGAGEPLVFRHHDGVVAAAWSPDGKRIAVTTGKVVRVLRAEDLGEILALRADPDALTAVAWSPDGKVIAAASEDGMVWLWADLEPLDDLDDPRLWMATTYCMPKERRMELLHVSEETAKAQQEACERRVERARAAKVGAH